MVLSEAQPLFSSANLSALTLFLLALKSMNPDRDADRY